MSDSRNLLAGRFAFQGRFRSPHGAPRFLAVESETGRRVVVCVVDAARVSSFEAARAIRHLHLAEVVELLRHFEPATLPGEVSVPAGAGLAIAELVPGRTLADEVAGKPQAPGKAVAWVLRLAEAVQALHARGSVHGAISPWAVIAEPEGRAIAPILSQLVRPPFGPYCPPERLKGAAEAASDDVWALYATLYTALTGKPPFELAEREALAKQMSVARPKTLKEHGIDEPVLSEIVSRGLIGERRLRHAELSELCKDLDGWERNPRAMPPRRAAAPRPAPKSLVDIIGGTGSGASRNDEIAFEAAFVADVETIELAPPPRAPTPPVLPPPLPATVRVDGGVRLADITSRMPPLPPSMPIAPVRVPSRRLSFNPFERKRRVWPLLALAAASGGIGVYVTVAPANTPPPAPVASSTGPAPKPRPIEKPKRSAAEELDACVRSYFPETAIAPAASLGFVCGDEDFRQVSRRFFALVREPTPAEAVDPKSTTLKSAAQPPLSALGWYELPATSMIRKSCCRSAAPIVLPETGGWCEHLQTAVRRIAEDSARAGDLAPAARSFEKAVSCLFANRIARPYTYERAPSALERRSFQHFLSLAAISEARR